MTPPGATDSEKNVGVSYVSHILISTFALMSRPNQWPLMITLQMPMVTLLSDFGLQDASVAIAKGLLMQLIPDAAITDITHEIRPYDTLEAAYVLSGAWPHFPPGTTHIILADLFSGRELRLLIARSNGHYFICPDNGVLPALLPHPFACWQFSAGHPPYSFTDWLRSAAAAVLFIKNTASEDFDLPVYQPRILTDSVPTAGDTVYCEVIHIDKYENVAINITQQQFEAMRKGRNFTLQFVQVEEITEISRSYNDVRAGTKLCRFNSNGYLEICVNRGNAASLFGLKAGSKKNDIKLVFG